MKWSDIDTAYRDRSLFEADLKRLKEYLKVTPDIPTGNNAGAIARVDRIISTIHQLISNLENEKSYKRSILWAKIAAIAACITVLIVLFQIWLQLNPSVFQHAKSATTSQLSSQNTQPTTTD